MDNAKIIKKANKQLIQIGLNVRTYRVMDSLTQAELAERAGLSVSAISKLENANVYTNSELVTILKIAMALNVHPSKLFEFRDKN